MRYLYVAFVRTAKVLARGIGLLAFLERRRDRFLFRYIRSLFSIYDVEDMIRLDLPWWTFRSIRCVESFLDELEPKANVFEYGAGASTIWLSKRAARVAYVEHDERFSGILENFFRGIDNISGETVLPTHKPDGKIICPSGRNGFREQDFVEYVISIRRAGGPFDLIIVDGRAREACLIEALQHLKPGGLILFDNSSRGRYQSALSKVDMVIERYRGLAPALPYFEETSIIRSKKVEALQA